MSWRLREFLVIGAIVVVFAFLLLGQLTVTDNDHAVINTWATEHDYAVQNIERCYFDHGPFWLSDEDDRIYRVEVSARREPRVVYFRFRLWGHDIEWYR